jgi:hypothetical protein
MTGHDEDRPALQERGATRRLFTLVPASSVPDEVRPGAVITALDSQGQASPWYKLDANTRPFPWT